MSQKLDFRTSGLAVERPQEETEYVVPVALRSAQHMLVSRGRFQPPWSKRLILIKWVIKGECVLGVGGRRVTFGPGQVSVYLPNSPHRFWANTDSNEMIQVRLREARTLLRHTEDKPCKSPSIHPWKRCSNGMPHNWWSFHTRCICTAKKRSWPCRRAVMFCAKSPCAEARRKRWK